MCLLILKQYADGKVCLSVLGTWHGHESEKWNPKQSSLYQVGSSLQCVVVYLSRSKCISF